MKLKALDQFHVSAVKADSLRPGEVFEVGKALGGELLAKFPSLFEMVDDEPAAKAEPAFENKALNAAPANKGKKGK